MKKIKVCTSCLVTYADGKPVTSQMQVTELMLKAYFDREAISIKKETCPNCRNFLPSEYWEKNLKKK